jgi:hypothetical protein
MMFLDEPCELDVMNEGSRIVEHLTALIDLARCRAPTFTAAVAMTIAEWRKLDAQISRFCTSEPKDRGAPKVIGGVYTLSLKNDGSPH